MVNEIERVDASLACFFVPRSNFSLDFTYFSSRSRQISSSNFLIFRDIRVFIFQFFNPLRYTFRTANLCLFLFFVFHATLRVLNLHCVQFLNLVFSIFHVTLRFFYSTEIFVTHVLYQMQYFVCLFLFFFYYFFNVIFHARFFNSISCDIFDTFRFLISSQIQFIRSSQRAENKKEIRTRSAKIRFKCTFKLSSRRCQGSLYRNSFKVSHFCTENKQTKTFHVVQNRRKGKVRNIERYEAEISNQSLKFRD